MTQLIKSELQHPKCGLSVAKMCCLAQITCAQFYRHRCTASVEQSNSQLHEAVKAVALEMPSYGYRRVTAHLRRGGRRINGKTVLRSMQRQNLLCKRRRRFVNTTDSQHMHRIYPNMTREMKVTDINWLWIADIAYVRLTRGFIYVAAVLDAYNHRVIGWAISRFLDPELALAAFGDTQGWRLPRPLFGLRRAICFGRSHGLTQRAWSQHQYVAAWQSV